jgi:putative ABC transport system permease protein
VILLSELQRLMDRPNEVTGLLVEAEPGTGREQLAELQRQIAALGPDISAEPTGEYVSSINQIRVSRAMAWLTSVIALVIGSIGILNTMIMSVFERTREIGTLRAIGWRKSRIVGMIVGEGLLLSVLGGVVGTLAAMAMLSVLSNMPATSGVIDGRIAPAVVAQGFVIAVLVGVAGAAYPAWWGASLLPTEALRGR